MYVGLIGEIAFCPLASNQLMAILRKNWLTTSYLTYRARMYLYVFNILLLDISILFKSKLPTVLLADKGREEEAFSSAEMPRDVLALRS